MVTEVNTRQHYHLRLTKRFVVYDPDRGLHIFRDWPKGAIVTDSAEVAFLEMREAPCERIYPDTQH
jgi:hypothetical protein